MVASNWTDADTARAYQIWQEYQTQHDVEKLRGKTAGIDPANRRVWFGESAADIVEQMTNEGISRPLFFIRVGSDYYLRKGGRR